MEDKSSRGGFRVGAGRKKGEKTKLVRVPEGCEDAVKGIIEIYKQIDDSYIYNDIVQTAENTSRLINEQMELQISKNILLAFGLTNFDISNNRRRMKNGYLDINRELITKLKD